MKTTKKRRTLRYADNYVHIALLFIYIISFFSAAGSLLVIFDLLLGIRITKVNLFDSIVIFLVTVSACLVIIAFWRRYWFLPVDLRWLITQHGGTDIRQQSSYRGVLVRGRLGSMWLLATLNSPILDADPMLHSYEFWRKLSRGFPEFMFEGARVSFVQPGDFDQLPQIDITVIGQEEISPAETGVPALDRAIKSAAQSLDDENITLRVEVRSQWLLVEVDGGVWLGARFMHKIEQAMKFSQILTGQLVGIFSFLDADNWEVEQKNFFRGLRDPPDMPERELYVVPRRKNA
ncbi:hypothetical protein [Desulfurivibrio dismutans]|uniref:hypothetical protein n=1 Tax=Desulfurivibrio dismutans TaxID=1398908 RepID=UPI0023DB547D|nr:hypothetical protein [Desulfurivibrio alkaliphilus]MDF1613698.1 hypothetical protein [Desulfurivibrio alkaliphilus]